MINCTLHLRACNRLRLHYNSPATTCLSFDESIDLFSYSLCNMHRHSMKAGFCLCSARLVFARFPIRDSDFSRHPKVFRLNFTGSSVGYLILYSPLSIMVFIVFQLSRLCPLVTQVLSDILVTVRSEQYSPLP